MKIEFKILLLLITGLLQSVIAKAQFPAYSSIDDLQAAQAFAIHGTSDSGAFGLDAATIGDFNNDGYDDIIIDARTSDNGSENSGSSYVIFGSEDNFPLNFDISQLDGSNGFAIHGVSANDTSGWSVSGAGDINNDGINDVLIGARSANPINNVTTGAAYIIYGTTDDMPAAFNLSALDGINGFRIVGESPADWFGSHVSDLGDVNNDNIDDIIIGANAADNNGSGSGAAYVVFGQQNFSASIQVADLDGTNGFRVDSLSAGDSLGVASHAGDVNADGINDILLGAYLARPDSMTITGEAYVLFGRDTAFGAVVDLSTLNSSTGWIINGSLEGDQFGREISYAGDINHDGIDDVAVHSRSDDTNGLSSGAVYVIYGTQSTAISVIDVSQLDGTNGFVMYGDNAGDQAGEKLGFAGDFNGDGKDDLIIGAPEADTPVTNAGSAYLLHGWDLPFPASFNLGNTSNSNGAIIEGNDTWDKTGSSVGTAGDFNADGVSDLIVAANGNDYNGASNGTVFVIFGSSDVIFKNSFDD